MKRLIDKHWGILVIFVLWLILIITNFAFGTWLSGWDNLHPEFTFALNLKRSFFSGWQEYQGLGLLGGMGHSSDLFRQVILLILSVIIPQNFLRYFFHFCMLFVGALGIYFLLKDFVLAKYSETTKRGGGIAAAVFYLLNFGTLQMFYTPYEAFSTHFGFLPWLFWGVFRYLREPSKKNVLIFILINVLSVSQGYVATVFLVYIMALVLMLVSYVASEVVRKGFFDSLRSLRMTGVILFVTFCVNAFWLLPNLHFLITDVGTNTGAKINLMSTENNLLLNKKYGDFKNVMLLKGFWFDNVELKNIDTMGYVMGDWVKHVQNPFIQGIGYLLFGFSVLGIVFAVKTKNKKALVFLPVFLLGFTFLANDTFGFSFIDKLLYKLPLVSQIFRFPFTKFSIVTAFCEAVFYGVSVGFIISKRKGFLHPFGLRSGQALVGMTVMIALPIVFMFPIFQGKLFYVKEKSKIPNEYFQVFKFFNEQDKNTRIVNFPQPTYWGWTNYRWNGQLYSGSGFLWYGIEQPILDRAFDVWSAQNENYYWEISYALYSKNKDLFEKVLEKYQINWLLVDGNVINPGSSKALFLDELEALLNGQQPTANKQQTKFELVKSFGKIKIYKVNLETPVEDFVWIGENLPKVNGYEWGNEDKAYSEIGNYVIPAKAGIYTNNEENLDRFQVKPGITMNYDIYYPFRTLFTGRTSENLDFAIEDKGDHFIFRKKLPIDLQNYDLIEPEYVSSAEDNYFVPRAEIINGNIEVNVPKTSNLTTVIKPFYDPSVLKAENCNQFSKGEVKSEGIEGDEGFGEKRVRLSAKDATNCSAAFYLPELLHKYGYLISVESKNISGKSLLFWVENLTNRKADQELYLDQKSKIKDQNQNSKLKNIINNSIPYKLSPNTYVIQPPMAEDGLGYSLHFDNVSIGREKTVNELGKITLNPIPYEYLMKIKLVNREGVNVSNLEGVLASHLEVNHPNPSLYKVKINGAVGENETLVLSQAYHEGWKAYEITNCPANGGISLRLNNLRIANLFPFFCGKSLDHVLVNNWENGWKISNSYSLTPTTYVLIFWPQYLEYLGFVIFIGALVSILLYNNHHK